MTGGGPDHATPVALIADLPKVGSELMDPDVDWAAVRAAYEDTDELVDAMVGRFGLTHWELRKRRTQDGWRPRPGSFQPASGDLPNRAEPLTTKLNRLLAQELAALEQRQQERGELADQDVQRVLVLARALALGKKGGRSRMAQQNRTRKSGKDAMAPASRPDGTKADARTRAGAEPGRDPRGDPAWARAELARRISMLREAR